MAEERVARDEKTILNPVKNGGNGIPPSSPSSSSNPTMNKGKSCKGCLYYSTTLKSNARNPLCIGITRSLPQVPRYIVGESEAEASKEGRSLSEFKYGCVGYSVYTDSKNSSGEAQVVSQTELPVCLGIEVLVDRKATNAASAPAHIHNKQDNNGIPQSRSPKPAHPTGDEFLSRFNRNANLVAKGVVKNARRISNNIKESIVDIVSPYRGRPK